MPISLRSWRLALVLVAAVGMLVVAGSAQAQEPPDIGASAIKNCPIQTAELGETVTCTFIVANLSSLDGVVTSLTETNPDPGTPVDISCTVVGGTEVISEGDTLAGNTLCAGTVDVTIPDDPALCGTSQTDRVEIALQYNQFDPPLTSGAFATHTFAIICPADISITKTADQLSKVGDAVTYTFQICNVGDVTVNRGTVTDTLLGNLTTFFPATLTPGQCVVVVRTRTVAAGDPDPLVNTVTATYTSGSGIFASSDTATATASTNLFQPSLTVTKTGDALSKVGDVVNYNIEVCNTSSADSPNLVKDSVSDNRIAGVNAAFGASLAAGACEDHDFTRTVQAGDPDPLVNTATAHYHPAGFPNDITDSDTHSTNLFQPNFTIQKTADALSKVSDAVNFRVTVTNTSSNDSPNLSCHITDALLGIDKTVSIAPGASNVTNMSRTTQAGDPDPLVNTASATCTVGGFPNVLGPKTASSSTNLFQPGVSVTKNCTPDPVVVGGVESCTIVVTNTSSADSPNLINGTIVDTLTGNLLDPANTAVTSSNCTPVLATGGTCTIVTQRTVLATDPNPLVNTVTVHYNPQGFPNVITATARESVVVTRPGGEGCTPGFWKQTQHFDSWVGFSPNQTLESVFDVPDALGLDNVTLAQALALNGGGVNALLRHAVAALLNASNPDVDFDLTAAQVISATNAALASGNYEAQKNIFERLNQQGCPLS
jgi:uncharacterized repeat protein (TIGR01451 family)